MPAQSTTTTEIRFPRIAIRAVSDLTTDAGFTHVVSIWNSDAAGLERQLREDLIANFPRARIHMSFFDDLEAPAQGFVAPGRNHIDAILSFTTAIGPDDALLVHCYAGISRSPGAALAIACQISGPGNESIALQHVLTERPQALPNSRIVSLADGLLGRHGEMIKAASAHRMAAALRGWVSE